jgi:hypothetical protein
LAELIVARGQADKEPYSVRERIGPGNDSNATD